MPRLPLSFRARASFMGLACFGLAVMAPAGVKGVLPFLMTPAGLGVAALALVAVGVSVEELGELRRIRLGVGLRVAAAAILAAGGLWAAALGAPAPSLARLGWVLYGVGATGVVLALRHDASVFRDPRHGQSVRLETISADAIRLTADGVPVVIPAALIVGVTLTSGPEGRGVFVLLRNRDKVVGNTRALPWAAALRDGDALLLTEHQAALDAEVLAARLLDAASASQGEYR